MFPKQTKDLRKALGKLYDLTTLQEKLIVFITLSASRTLQIAQSLYEKHKAITYPRTDSKALPEDYGSICKEIPFRFYRNNSKHLATRSNRRTG